MLFEYFSNLIGKQQELEISFDLQSIYTTQLISQQENHSLTQPWTDTDIRQAVRSWKSNKAPGPDGFTGDFYNAFLDILLPDLKEVFLYVNSQPEITLHPLNDSLIVLVPKKQPAVQPTDFRPISLINGIQKIYSKIMAAKLTPLLDKLLSSNQTGFLKGRGILHGFHYAQQVIQSATAQRAQIANFKADIFKTFDTLNWHFLLESLKARGFPHTWVRCIQNNILRGKSRIVLNSVAGRTITLKRGVRQGDPLAPYLFNLSIDLLARWIQKLNQSNFLAPPFPNCRSCLLYADDTLIFLKPTTNQLVKVRLLFDIFGAASGLNINLAKSELTVTASSPPLVQHLASLIQCKSQSFPVRYLGLPLSDKALVRSDFLPLIDRIQATLSGWKASLLSMGGRYILTNTVLTAIPLYFMSTFLLPKWVTKKIDQIRRKFLCHGHRDRQIQERCLYMVNWDLVTRPKELGGLGIRDIAITNQALLMKWMWQWNDQNQPWWTQATIMSHPSDKPWHDPHGSPFWKKMKTIEPAFNSSVSYTLGNGNKIQFWHDNWLGTPLKFLFPNLYQSAQLKHLSVANCIQDGAQWHLQLSPTSPVAQSEKEQLLSLLHQVQSTQQIDAINWLRCTGNFSVKSAYKFLSHRPSPTSPLNSIWHIKAPLRITIFAWLLLNNRLTTIDNLVRRGWYLPNMCAMCKSNEENICHLFSLCIVAKELREYIYTAFSDRYSIPPKFTSTESTCMMINPTVSKQAKQLEITTCSIIWRERCRRIFAEMELQPISLVREIRAEWTNWFGDPPILLFHSPN